MISKQQIESLVNKKNINNPHFVKVLFYFFNCVENLDHRTSLFNVLSDDNNLISDQLLKLKNFKINLLGEIGRYCPLLKDNPCLYEFVELVYGYRAKGIGKGEYLFPFLFQNWKYSSKGDAMVFDSVTGTFLKGEGKNSDGASLKPMLKKNKKTGVKAPNQGTIDRLNASIFANNKPFTKAWVEYCSSLSGDEMFTKTKKYFTTLFPSWDLSSIDNLSTYLSENFQDLDKSSDFYSLMVFDHYKQIEGFDFLFMLDDNMNLVIINDTTDMTLSTLGVRFKPVMARGGDTQAVPDGYVNIFLVKS